MQNGIDIYEGDNIQDWNLIKQQGIKVVIQKATQGVSHVDSLLNYRYPLIKKAELNIGFYHFAQYNSTGPVAEAKYFLNSINGLNSDTVLWLDIEAEEKWDKQAAINYANAFIEYIKSQGFQVGIYTGEAFYNDYLVGNIPDIPLWLASYGKQPSLYPESASWQYSESGNLNGAVGNVDLDYFIDNIFVSGGVKKVNSIVIYNDIADQRSAEMLADFLNCPSIWGARKFDYTVVKNVYGIGGSADQYTSYLTKLISGGDRYVTNQAVLDFIKNGGK